MRFAGNFRAISVNVNAWGIICRLAPMMLLGLMLTGCAHMDNSFLRSAEPLSAGQQRVAHAHSSSYSYAPALVLSPDSLNVFSERERRPLISMQHPLQWEVGISDRFGVGLQLCAWLGRDFKHQGFEDTDLHLAPSAAGKAFMHYAISVSESKWLAVTPGVTAYADIQKPHKNMLLRQRITGWELPLTYTCVNHRAETKTSDSFTFRYGQQKVLGELKVKIPTEPFSYDQLISTQPDATAHRVALIYTFNHETGNKGKFVNLGMELTLTENKWSYMPVFGISWYSLRK